MVMLSPFVSRHSVNLALPVVGVGLAAFALDNVAHLYAPAGALAQEGLAYIPTFLHSTFYILHSTFYILHSHRHRPEQPCGAQLRILAVVVPNIKRFASLFRSRRAA